MKQRFSEVAPNHDKFCRQSGHFVFLAIYILYFIHLQHSQYEKWFDPDSVVLTQTWENDTPLVVSFCVKYFHILLYGILQTNCLQKCTQIANSSVWDPHLFLCGLDPPFQVNSDPDPGFFQYKKLSNLRQTDLFRKGHMASHMSSCRTPAGCQRRLLGLFAYCASQCSRSGSVGTICF